MPKHLLRILLVLIMTTPLFAAMNYSAPVKETVMEGLARPWSIAFISEDVALVSEKDGNLLRVSISQKTRTIIKGFPEDLAGPVKVDLSKYPKGTYPNGSDGRELRFNAGIFDVVIDPDFNRNSFVYISYAATKGEKMTTKVIRGILKSDQLTHVKTILEAGPYTHGGFHFGGGMTFGTDGKLYITVGERLFSEANEPPMPVAQDLADRRGKIYRMNSDGSIPADNPDFGETAIPGIYAAGIRAAQGITVEPKTGKIWFSEHGTNQGDEINLLRAGANYGWPNKTTGTYRADYQPPKLDVVFSEPVWYWTHTVAPTGLTFYSGTEFPQWKGDLLVSGLSRGSLWRLRIENETVKSLEELFVDDRVRARKIAQSPGGKLYLLTDEENGRIIRIKNNSANL